MIINLINKYLNYLNINISSSCQQLLLTYWNFLLATNNSINLISRQGSMEFRIVNHLIDSLSPLSLEWPDFLNMMDFGSGAGLPGIPLKICRPNWSVTLVESRLKKANFLSETCNILKLNELNVINSYVDNKYNFKNNFKFDLITVRAVSNINNLIPKIYKFLKVNGIFLVYKGPNYINELNDSLAILNKYNFILYKKHTFILPLIEAERNLLFFKKV
jgi:16S rRNA (guanine527-N7)-methyltransferase